MPQSIDLPPLMAADTALSCRPVSEHPVSGLRFSTPSELFSHLPQIRRLMAIQPGPDDSNLHFLRRLHASQTPEEAVTFAAFAMVPAAAIRWGYECLRAMAEHLNPAERPMMEQIAEWITQASAERRHLLMQAASNAAVIGPSVYLAQAAGWSGGGVSPDDSLPPEPWRCPDAVNSAVLACLARAGIGRRSEYLSWFMEMADLLMQP